MTESGGGEGPQDLFMSVVGYEVLYGRSTAANQPISSWVEVTMSVKGAKVEHLANKPISRAIVVFTDRNLETSRVGNISNDTEERDTAIFAKLPYADFPGFWAALRLDRVARLAITIDRGTNNVSSLSFRSQDKLFPLFPVV
jgi:hypothetical protein